MENLEKIKNSFAKLVEIMAELRSERGCPWDKEQTYESLRQYLLEETFEVLELIDEACYDELKNELGDLLLQVIFQSQIAKEEGRFDIQDVVDNINKKLIYRHPNVFGDTIINTAEEQTVNWEKMKKKENSDRSVIAGVPKQLPALLRAHRIQQKAATVGFDWKNTLPVFEKVEEELNELKQAIKNKNTKEIEEEIGDLLFTIVNLSRFIHVNPEDSLRLSINKFVDRFKKMEKKIKETNQTFEGMSLKEMDKIWDEIKDESKI
jgi:tetrapyrrole methylase family protein / MazG family protein